MNPPILLPEHLYSKATGQIDVDQLEKLSEQYPYSAIVQFYLLAALKDHFPSKPAQACKTALFFPNTNWLSWQLHWLKESLNSWDQQVLGSSRWKNMLAEPAAEAKNHPAATDVPAFEPLHIVDYFASQGITITENEAGDKLGKQLKSFTEWLKTMKKIQPEGNETARNQSDQQIQSIAETSNDDTNVITEAMASVLEKQGKTIKAMEIYQKLSLTNPAKSAYFAAKIDSLKGS